MDSNKRGDGALGRGLAILSLLAERGERPVAGLAEDLGLSRSAAYRLTDTLKQYGFVKGNPNTGGVSLGPAAMQVGLAAISHTDLLRAAPPVMSSLASLGVGTCFLAVPEGVSMVYVAREEGPQSLNLSARLGSRRPMYSTSLGKAYLASLPDSDRDHLIRQMDLIQRTPSTITSVDELVAAIETSKKDGFAVDDRENEAGVGGIASAVLDSSGSPVASLSIAGSAERILPEAGTLGSQISEAAASISSAIGFDASRMREAL